MANAHLDNVLYHLRKLAGGRPEEAWTDGQLLEHFLSKRDEAAFTTLVERHGPLVLGVCRRVLANDADAADAFQATFLVLARKAASIRKRESVGSWLYGVAYRLAHRAKVAAARRRVHERQVEPMPPSDPLAAVVWRDLRPILDEELDKLADKYRAPLVLCYLEGKTHEEAAQQLGWTNGTGPAACLDQWHRLRPPVSGARTVAQTADPARRGPVHRPARHGALPARGGRRAGDPDRNDCQRSPPGHGGPERGGRAFGPGGLPGRGPDEDMGSGPSQNGRRRGAGYMRARCRGGRGPAREPRDSAGGFRPGRRYPHRS